MEQPGWVRSVGRATRDRIPALCNAYCASTVRQIACYGSDAAHIFISAGIVAKPIPDG